MLPLKSIGKTIIGIFLLAGCERGYDLVIPEPFEMENVPEFTSFQEAENMDTIAVLTFGNSFSYDALYYLPSIAHSRGKVIISGNLVLGGCSLERHWTNVKESFVGYDYFKDAGMEHQYLTGYPIEQAYYDEDWDVVVFQQAALRSGDYNSYVPYIFQIHETMMRTLKKNVAYVWHQTWAFPENSDYDSFEAYKYSQNYMYECIVAASCRISKELGSRCFFPSGTAIQNMRQEIGDNLCRDNRHLNDLGRYTAACVWYESLFGEAATTISYHPSTITEEAARLAREAAHRAILSPFSVWQKE